MTSKLTILSIDPETAGENVRRMQEALCLLEQLRQLLKNIGSHDLADLAVCAAQELQEAVRCIRESARKYENVVLEPSRGGFRRRLAGCGGGKAAGPGAHP